MQQNERKGTLHSQSESKLRNVINKLRAYEFPTTKKYGRNTE